MGVVVNKNNTYPKRNRMRSVYASYPDMKARTNQLFIENISGGVVTWLVRTKL